MSLLQATELAAEAHKEQARDLPGGGTEPYVNHPVRVAELLHEEGFGELVCTVAVLHDVLEDTNVTWVRLYEKFGPVVAGGVDLLTKGKGPYSNRRYKARLQLASSWVKAVKLADRVDNLRSLAGGVESWDKGRIRAYLEDSRDLVALCKVRGAPLEGSKLGNMVGLLEREIQLADG